MADVKALTRKAIDDFNQRKLDEWSQMVADDAELISPVIGRIKGREEIRSFFEGMHQTFPDIRVTIHGMVAEGNTVATEYEVTGTNRGPSRLPSGETIPPTNKCMNVWGVDIGTYDARGRLKTLHQYWDTATVFRQLGLMPAPAAARG